ncbi:MAG: hypothetical protein WKF80_03455 [Thermomicrobiales bacterium]
MAAVAKKVDPGRKAAGVNFLNWNSISSFRRLSPLTIGKPGSISEA